MATRSEIEQEKRRISERLARVDAEQTRLADQLNELEVAERVLSRFGGATSPAERRRRGRSARTAAAVGGQRRARVSRRVPSVSLSDATLQAVKAHPQGTSANEISSYLAREFGMVVRANHLGIALQRHRRAGRLGVRDQLWYIADLEASGLPSEASGLPGDIGLRPPRPRR
jgi:hypothetical protein